MEPPPIPARFNRRQTELVEHRGGGTGRALGSEGQDWAAAQASCEAEIAAGAGGEAHQHLAVALLWQNKLEPAVRAMEDAYLLFRRRGEYGRAAWAALWIGGQYLRLKGNRAVAGGWI